MAGRKPKYKPQIRREPYQPDFLVENDLDYTSPYPCGVCGRTFNSRSSLATHKHPRKGTA